MSMYYIMSTASNEEIRLQTRQATKPAMRCNVISVQRALPGESQASHLLGTEVPRSWADYLVLKS